MNTDLSSQSKIAEHMGHSMFLNSDNNFGRIQMVIENHETDSDKTRSPVGAVYLTATKSLSKAESPIKIHIDLIERDKVNEFKSDDDLEKTMDYIGAINIERVLQNHNLIPSIGHPTSKTDTIHDSSRIGINAEYENGVRTKGHSEICDDSSLELDDKKAPEIISKLEEAELITPETAAETLKMLEFLKSRFRNKIEIDSEEPQKVSLSNPETKGKMNSTVAISKNDIKFLTTELDLLITEGITRAKQTINESPEDAEQSLNVIKYEFDELQTQFKNRIIDKPKLNLQQHNSGLFIKVVNATDIDTASNYLQATQAALTATEERVEGGTAEPATLFDDIEDSLKAFKNHMENSSLTADKQISIS